MNIIEHFNLQKFYVSISFLFLTRQKLPKSKVLIIILWHLFFLSPFEQSEKGGRKFHQDDNSYPSPHSGKYYSFFVVG